MPKVIREQNLEQKETDTQVVTRKKRGGAFRYFVLLILVGAALAYFLPNLVALACLSPSTLAWVSGQPEGALEIGEAEFSWQGPTAFTNVVLNGADGKPVANVDRLSSEISFWDLLTKKVATLKLKLDGIRLTVTVPNPEGPPTGRFSLSEAQESIENFRIPHPNRPVELQVTNCTIDFQNPERVPLESWSGLSGSYLYEDNGKFRQLVNATLPASAEGGTGELQLQGEWSQEASGTQSERMSLSAQGDRVSLAMADAWLRKYLGEQHQLKSCTGKLSASFQRDPAAGWSLVSSVSMNEPHGASATNEQVAFAEPGTAPVQLEVQGAYSKETDELSIPRLQLAADNAAVDLKGSVKEVNGRQLVDVLAEVKTPGNALMDLLPVELREQIQVEGMKFSQISIKGSLLPAADGSAQPLQYSLIASWDQAIAYGLVSQNGQIRVSYREGQVIAEPLQVPVNGGRLVQLPVLDLRTEPLTVRFQAGGVLENVKLTEPICRDWLKYISPTLADATSADGSLSLAMNACEFQLGGLDRADLSGVVAIRNGQVRPGPLANQMLQQVMQVRAILNRTGEDLTTKAFLTMKQEDIPFRLYQGRVYHENFGADVGEMRISTAGSVGLDQTLGLNLNILFPEKWLANNRPVLQALASQPISLGISGTFNEPRIDASRLADFGKQLGIKAGIGLIEKLIERRQERNR